MKVLTAFLLTALIGLNSVLCADVEALLGDLAGTDYEARQEARNQLYSLAAEVTSGEADPAAKAGLTANLLAAVQADAIDQQGKVFLTRIITRIGTGDAAESLYAIATSAGQSGIVREHAAMALSALPGEKVTTLLLNGLTGADAGERGRWWQAVQHQAAQSNVADIIKAVKKSKLEGDPLAWLTLGQIGGQEAAGYLLGLLAKVDGANLGILERAILDTGGCSATQLRQLLNSTTDADVATGAFGQLLISDPKAGLAELKSALAAEPSPRRQRMIRLSLETGDESHWETVARGISQLAPREVDTFLACVREQERAEFEGLVIKCLEIEDVSTEKEALSTLAAIGTKRSTSSLLQRMDSGNDEIDDLVIYALSQIKDPELDEKLIAAVNNPGSENRAEMIRLLAVRNNEGASDLLNSILLAGSADPDIDAILQSTEEIGNINSCRILLSRIIDDLPRSDLRKYQLSLKRLVIRLALNDHLWSYAFQPALQLASSDDIRAAIVEILDCLSSEQALDYCTGLVEPNQPEVLQNASLTALKRWTSLNSADFWVKILTDGDTEATEKQEATSALVRLIKASAVEGSDSGKAQLAFHAILDIDEESFTESMLAAVRDSSSLKRQFGDVIKPYKELVSRWEALD